MARVGLIGSGPLGESYAHALVHLDQVALTAAYGVPSLGGRADRRYADPFSMMEEAPLDAVVLASPAGDSNALLRAALLRRLHVLSAGPHTLSSQQIERLAHMSQRAGRILMFGEERFLSPGFAFLEQATGAAADRSWRSRYLRLLDVRAHGRRGGLRLGSVAVEDMAACLRLFRRTPRTVNAVGSRGFGGAVEAAFINMVFATGAVASLQISIAEAGETWQVVAALGGRTIVLDDLDPHMPLRVTAETTGPTARAAGAPPPPETGVWQTDSMAFAGERFDGPLAQVRRLLDSMASSERPDKLSNAELWSQAASLWEAAESSLALAGAPVPIQHYWSAAEGTSRARQRPSHLRVIAGSRSEPVAAAPHKKRPALRVLSV